MRDSKLHCVFLGLSITSTWGNGHATTYRSLLKELAARGHKLTFLERDVPWYSSNREFDKTDYCRIGLYESLDELKDRWSDVIRDADVVIVGSYVPEGILVGEWVISTARNLAGFYDIDTPVTLAHLRAGDCEYLRTELVSKYNLYLSFTGGPTLRYIERELGSPCAQALYCSVDPALYYPEKQRSEWDIGYLGTYAEDRQPNLEKLLFSVARKEPERRFVVAGPQYPDTVEWPANVQHVHHLPASSHRKFYNSQRFTLNLTRRDMIRAGYSPSVRLFEAAACGVPIISDSWPGLETIFQPGVEILLARKCQHVSSYLRVPDEKRLEISARARARTLRLHTARVRAEQFETYVIASLEQLAASNRQRRSFRTRPAAALI